MRTTRTALPVALALALVLPACKKTQEPSEPAATAKPKAAPKPEPKTSDKTAAVAKAPTTPPTTTLDVPTPGSALTTVQNSRGRRAFNRLHQRIYRRVRSKLRRVNACYALQRRRNPRLSGKLTVQMTVEPPGSVSDAHVVSRSLNSAALEGCVVSTVRSFTFDPLRPAHAVTLVLPLLFR